MVGHKAKIQLSNMRIGFGNSPTISNRRIETYSGALSYLLGAFGCLRGSLGSEGVEC